jgi:hypothetical protein
MVEGGGESAEIFTIENEQVISLGFAGRDAPLVIDGYSVRMGAIKRYTGLFIYNRPQEPVLVLGCILMLAGLVWHFYHRYRNSKSDSRGAGSHA